MNFRKSWNYTSLALSYIAKVTIKIDRAMEVDSNINGTRAFALLLTATVS